MIQRNAHPSGAPQGTPDFSGFVLLNIKFTKQCFVDHCQSFCPLYCLSFHLRLPTLAITSSLFYGSLTFRPQLPPEHLSSPPVFREIRVARSLVVFCRLLFVLFLLTIVLSVLLFTASDYPFGIFTLLTIVLAVLLFTASDYPFGIFTLLTIVLAVLLFTASDYPFGIFNPFFITAGQQFPT